MRAGVKGWRELCAKIKTLGLLKCAESLEMLTQVDVRLELKAKRNTTKNNKICR